MDLPQLGRESRDGMWGKPGRDGKGKKKGL